MGYGRLVRKRIKDTYHRIRGTRRTRPPICISNAMAVYASHKSFDKRLFRVQADLCGQLVGNWENVMASFRVS